MRSPASYIQPEQIIQNVKIRLSADGNIQVEMPEEIISHYRKDKELGKKISFDGWYATGVSGVLSEKGISVGASKKRSVTSSKKEDIMAAEIKMIIGGKCHYISFISTIGLGGDHPAAILFPKTDFFRHPEFEITPLEGCFCPRDVRELGKCLSGCLHDANCHIGRRFSKIKSFLIADTTKLYPAAT
jgi:hypothetical protein